MLWSQARSAPSRSARSWQCKPPCAIAQVMTGLPISILLAGALAASAPAFAHGAIGTVPRGTFVCELPGDAAGQAGVAQPERNFTIESASRYSSPQGGGSYLRRGDTLTLTSGPRQ